MRDEPSVPERDAAGQQSKVRARIGRSGRMLVEVATVGDQIRLTIEGGAVDLTAAESEAIGYALLLAGLGTFR